jgi:predicted dehydrogenase
MNQEKVRIGIVGAGAIAQAYAQVLESEGSWTPAGVTDVRADAAKAFAERLGCKSYGSYLEMADQGKCDAVIICTPPSTHEEIAVCFLKKRVHVLCEKPLSLTLESALAMQKAAESNKAILTMASKFRFVEDIIRAKSIMASGVLGTVVLLENAFTSRVNMASRWNSNAEVSGGGVLVDNGTHSVDLVRYFLGPITEVQAIEAPSVQNLSVEDTVQLFVKTAGGTLGRIDLSWSIDKHLPSFLNIHGSHGTLSVGWKESKYRQWSSPDWVVFGKGYDKAATFRAQLQNFCNAIRMNEPLLNSPEDARASIEVVRAGYKSLSIKRWVTVEPECPERLVEPSKRRLRVAEAA